MKIEELQILLDQEFGKDVIKVLSKRLDGTVNIKGLFEKRIKVRYFLKKNTSLVCNNFLAEKREVTSVVCYN